MELFSKRRDHKTDSQFQETTPQEPPLPHFELS